ncbi:hypothetical protein [Bradyrhizobium sp. Cp5.3]|uniref:hypothetical protein n=1 Tax=Bradyrhizobium sp. Cp5.3 TaxID=443598 RepID=UPI000482FDF8|nr:hypothetical protein [Bradyrhizobium sp. Cp5.3]
MAAPPLPATISPDGVSVEMVTDEVLAALQTGLFQLRRHFVLEERIGIEEIDADEFLTIRLRTNEASEWSMLVLEAMIFIAVAGCSIDGAAERLRRRLRFDVSWTSRDGTPCFVIASAAKQSRNLSAATVWIASLRSQ